MCASAKSDLSLNNGISGGRVGCYVFKYLRIWRKVSFMRRSSFIEQPLLVKPHLQQPVHCLKFFFFFFFLITRTLKQDDLAAAFSTTSLTELEQNHSSGRKRPEFVRRNSEVFLFCVSVLSVNKPPKEGDKYLGNREAAI